MDGRDDASGSENHRAAEADRWAHAEVGGWADPSVVSVTSVVIPLARSNRRVGTRLGGCD